MKERLVQLLDMEQLTPSKFADIIGVQRSSVSHVVSGRNKPSFDFLQKTLKAFPGLNAEWLILGEGTMYEQMGRGVSGTLFNTPVEPAELLSNDNIAGDGVAEDQIWESDTPKNEYNSSPDANEHRTIPDAGDDRDVSENSKAPLSGLDQPIVDNSGSERKVVQVMVIYDDDTFRSYGPSK